MGSRAAMTPRSENPGPGGDPPILDDSQRDALVRLCWGYLGRIEDAEDAAQEVLRKALQLPKPPDHPGAWLYRVARNHCLTCLRLGTYSGRERSGLSSWQQIASA